MYDSWKEVQDWFENEASPLEAAAFAGWCSGAFERGARAKMAREQRVVVAEALIDMGQVLFPGETPIAYPTKIETRLSEEGERIEGLFYRSTSTGWGLWAVEEGDGLDWSMALAFAARAGARSSVACRSKSWQEVGSALEARHPKVAKWAKLSEEDFNVRFDGWVEKSRHGDSVWGADASPEAVGALSDALWGLRRVADLCDGGDELVELEAVARDGSLHIASLRDQNGSEFDCAQWVGEGWVGRLDAGPLKWAEGLGRLVGKNIWTVEDRNVWAKLEAMFLRSEIPDPKTGARKFSL